MNYYHIQTREWITGHELQERLSKGYDFKCNDCHKSIGDHVKVVAEGIFCVDCGNNLIEKIKEIARRK